MLVAIHPDHVHYKVAALVPDSCWMCGDGPVPEGWFVDRDRRLHSLGGGGVGASPDAAPGAEATGFWPRCMPRAGHRRRSRALCHADVVPSAEITSQIGAFDRIARGAADDVRPCVQRRFRRRRQRAAGEGAPAEFLLAKVRL
jgi:hypothetical protein